MQENQIKRNSLELEDKQKNREHNKRSSVQTPLEDAIFLEDQVFTDINDSESPEKGGIGTDEELPSNQNMSQVMGQVDQLSKKTVIRKVLDFSKDLKKNEEVVIILKS
jgi:hypothetical protein